MLMHFNSLSGSLAELGIHGKTFGDIATRNAKATWVASRLRADSSGNFVVQGFPYSARMPQHNVASSPS